MQIEAARRNPKLVVGFDFAFSLPRWFARERGIQDGLALWDLVASEGEQWLRECAPPFWGRPGKSRPDMEEQFRRADTEVPSTGGIRPKSVFQIGGAGAVGTGSIRGMPILKRLRDHGFSIWPFDEPRLPMVVEIYPRALTGPVNKGSAADRAAYLDSRHPDVDSRFRQLGASSEDAFDALVSALVMAEHASDLMALEPARDEIDRLEGRIWLPSDLQVRATRPTQEKRPSSTENDDAACGLSADVDRVPTISAFYGIVIRMYADDHAPPHFHAKYAEHRAVVDIDRAVIIRGSLPATARRLVLEWAAINHDTLLENWTLCGTHQEPKPIRPLT